MRDSIGESKGNSPQGGLHILDNLQASHFSDHIPYELIDQALRYFNCKGLRLRPIVIPTLKGPKHDILVICYL